jgi:hypothetical protein
VAAVARDESRHGGGVGTPEPSEPRLDLGLLADRQAIPGLGPDDGFTQSVCNLEHADAARDAWQRLLENPGPIVVGTAQGDSCFGASDEFLFNVRHRDRKAGLEDVAPVTLVSSERFLGHFGLGGVGDSGVNGSCERWFLIGSGHRSSSPTKCGSTVERAPSRFGSDLARHGLGLNVEIPRASSG